MAPAAEPTSPLPEGEDPTSDIFAAPILANTDTRNDSTSSSGGPKTCARCGRHFESNEVEAQHTSAANVEPSPSSVAFAAQSSTSAQMASIFASNAPTGTDSMVLDEDGHQICSSCASIPRSLEMGTIAIRRAERRARSGTIQPLSQSVQEEEEEDTEMTLNQGVIEAGTTSLRARDSTPTHPWRRTAPWTRAQSGSENMGVEAGQDPLYISVAGIGAGGDAEMTSTHNQDDFPPLPRSPRATALSPQFPTSSPRTRSAISPPTTPSSIARRTSFSRSQTGPSAATSSSLVSPVVNLSSRGRNRDGSLTSSTAVAISSPPLLTRRTSSHRRLSRSSSSQGPTTTAFAESATTLIPVESEIIGDVSYGPSAMTRSRLSTLTPSELASSAVTNTTLTDLYDRQSGPQGAKEEKEEEELKQRLTWFRYNRPDPRRDLSKLRCTSRGRGCLFPGATFNGTQKSGRMSYDVTVQIVNVDMASSHLCGYLNIRGLTDDWPELTTYFDAEIIGMRYGFLTGKWGAQEADDMKHWGRFAPFRPLKNNLIKPGLRFNHMNKPYVFMRWKECFLVPDHRVRDINGASFAGFYYVCVELGEDEAGQSTLMAPLSPTVGSSGGGVDFASPALLPHHHHHPQHHIRTRSASNRRRSAASSAVEDRSAEVASTADTQSNSLEAAAAVQSMDAAAAAAATAPHVVTMGRMSGFYFHEHSEPYQQLTLQHVRERSSATFELR